MESLFSHPVAEPDPSQPGSSDLDPLVFTVVVPTNVSHAFMGFTDHPHLWWPLEELSVFGADAHVEFEENLILETAEDGRTSVWGTIDDWQPPLSFHADWYPASTALWSTEIRVVFRAVNGGTEVRVIHDGWEGAEEPLATRDSYADRWPRILERFTRFMGGVVG
ncbi:SRPBCC domain-containing protein [Arthrobacter sp. fls2-241-R2A-200]|uniref:SRPBCC domain-containing protein n=1 Tax=Arthrobacter sp. fls2-241-R2A-200 TaxID=3040281 RepID=UPI00254CF307|nr:SRPBCC domain-containing protein [Arthrobacter sp. fls2-241-R2A-200]